MMNKSNYLRNAWISTLRGVEFTPPEELYVGLFTAAPTSAGGGTEVTGGAYVRQPITLAAPVNGATSNSNLIEFPTPTADWGNIVAAAVFDEDTGGSMLYFGGLSVSKLILASDDVFFPVGYFQITET